MALKKFVSRTESLLTCKWQHVFQIAVLMVKGHHLSLAIGNLTCSIRRTECLRQLEIPQVLLSARQIETWSATVSGQNRSGLKAGHFKGKRKVFWGVTWQAAGTVPTKV